SDESIDEIEEDTEQEIDDILPEEDELADKNEQVSKTKTSKATKTKVNKSAIPQETPKKVSKKEKELELDSLDDFEDA
ncbi:MAG: hypothetical protein ACP5LM_04235, partial [Thermoplasmata archaeon]